MSRKLSIGTVAKMKGISIKTLRYYDEIGLLKPSHVDPFSGYRYYDSSQLLYIEFIILFRRSGASLEEIASACKDDNAMAIADFSDKQIEKARQKIAELEEGIHNYKELCSKIYNDEVHSRNQEVYWQRVKERTVLTREIPSKQFKEEWIYDAFWHLYQEIRNRNLATLYATGYIVELGNENEESLTYKKIYVEAEEKENCQTVSLETLPKGEYLCVNYRIENKKAQMAKLHQAVREKGRTPRLCVELDTYTNVIRWDNPLQEMQVLF